MNIDEINKVAVIGAGLMGSGIAQVFAQSGYQVILIDISQEQLQRGRENIEKYLQKMVVRKTLPSAVKEVALDNISYFEKLEVAAETDFLIEAVTENKELKKSIFSQLENICRPEVVFGSNTSSIPITELAASTQRPNLFIGTHFMSPVPFMRGVELIRGLETSIETFNMVEGLMKRIGKEPCESNDYPGFASNRIFMALLNEAFYCVYEGIGTPENIDKVITLSLNHPIGPLRLADNVGLDTVLNVLEVLHEGYRNPKYAPCPLLVKMVKAGWLGKKTKRGFYIY